EEEAVPRHREVHPRAREREPVRGAEDRYQDDDGDQLGRGRPEQRVYDVSRDAVGRRHTRGSHGSHVARVRREIDRHQRCRPETAYRTPRIWTPATAAIMATPARLWPSGVSGTNSPK